MMHRMRALIFAAVAALASCSLDPWGWLWSSDVDDRFAEDQALEAKPDVAAAGDFSFIVIADTHVHPGAGTQDMFQALAADLLPGDRFVLVCGDLVQNGATADFQTFAALAASLGIPVYSTPGNHDLYNGGWEGYRDTLGRSLYTFAAGPVRVIALDSANGTLGGLQRQWLEETLAARSEPLCVTFTHFQFFTDKLTETQQWTDFTEAYSLMHLLESSGVGLHFSGHSHRWLERTINGTAYCTVADFGSGAFMRVSVTAGALTYSREQL